MGAFDTMDLDSVVFRLAPALTARNTSATYTTPFSYRYPLTPYCPSGGGIKCTPQPTLTLPRGFYYDSLTGIAVFIPTKCDELSVLAIEVIEFRKVNGKWEVISKSQMEKQIGTSDNCTNNYYTKLTLKARDTATVGKLHTQKMYSKDDTGALSKIIDTTTILVLNMPNGATYVRNSPFRAYDSGVFKWTPGNKWADINYKLYVAAMDNKCDIPFYELKIQNLLIKSIKNEYRIRTYHDKNGNCKRDSNETYTGKVRFVIEGSQPGLDQYVETNDTGFLKTTIAYGPRKIHFIPNEIFYSNCSGLQLNFVKLDSTFYYEIPVKRRTFIRGTFFNDHDSDCMQNKILDIPVDKVLVKSNKGHSTWTLNDGSFLILCDTGTYNLELADYFSVNACSTASKLTSIQVLKDSFVDLGKLPVFNRITDLEVTMSAGRLLRGGTTTIILTVKNIGSNNLQTFTSGNYPKFYLEYPKKLTFSNCAASCSNDTAKALLNWTLSNIENGASAIYTASFLADQTKYKVGDDIILSAFLDSSFTDFRNDNNAFGLKITVRGPYDPNRKLSETSDSGVCSEPLVYRIDFQNTGTDTAFDVLVTDTLSNLFDLNTMKPISSSAPVLLSTENYIAKFLFRNHKLTDSITSLAKSRGFIIYSVKLKDTIYREAIIQNKASIVFDYEKPVLTNTHQFKTIPYVEIVSLDKSKYCEETEVVVSYKANYIGTTTKLQLQLSDSSGSFSTNTVLRNWISYPDPDLRTLKFTLPSGLPPSGKYRLRIAVTDPKSNSFIKPSIPFELTVVPAQMKLNKMDYCDKDSIFIILSGALSHSIYFNGNTVRTNVADGTFFIGIASLTKNDIKVVSEYMGCFRTRNFSASVQALPTFNTILVYETICTDSMSKVAIIGQDKYSIYWKGNAIYDTVPKGIYPIPGGIKKDTFYIYALSKYGCKSNGKFLGPVYEQVTWTAKIADLELCRGNNTKLSLNGLSTYNVTKSATTIYKGVGSGSFTVKVPKSQEPMLVIGYSNLGCTYTKNLATPKINNESNFLSAFTDNAICQGSNTYLQLHDRNYFDIYKAGNLMYSGHDSSAISFSGDTQRQTLTIIGKTPFGCLDTQWVNTPLLDNWEPISVSVKDSLLCFGDSTELHLNGRPKFDVYQAQNTIYTSIKSGIYTLPADTNILSYQIIGISPIGCRDSVSVNGPSQEQFHPKLIGQFAIPPFCDGDSIEFSYQGSAYGDLYNYGTKTGSITQYEMRKVSVPAKNGIKLQARYTSDLGCDYASNELTYISNPIPSKPRITRSGDTLMSSSPFYNNWYYFSGQATGKKDTFPALVPDSNATYFVKVISTAGCFNQSDTVQFQKKTNAVRAIGSGNWIQFIPNPFSSSIRIRSNTPLQSASIFSLDGRLQKSEQRGLNTKEIELVAISVSPGIYIAEIITQDQMVMRYKVIKIAE